MGTISKKTFPYIPNEIVKKHRVSHLCCLLQEHCPYMKSESKLMWIFFMFKECPAWPATDLFLCGYLTSACTICTLFTVFNGNLGTHTPLSLSPLSWFQSTSERGPFNTSRMKCVVRLAPLNKNKKWTVPCINNIKIKQINVLIVW